MNLFQTPYQKHSKGETQAPTEDLTDPIYSAFIHQVHGANELHRYRLSQSSTPFDSTDNNHDWPLRTTDNSEHAVFGSPAEGDSFMHQQILGDELLSHGDDVSNTLPQGRFTRRAQRTSEYLEDLVSHYLHPQRSFSFRTDEGLTPMSRKGKNQTIIPKSRSFYNPFTAILLLLTTGISIFTAIYASGTTTTLLNVHFFSSSSSHSLLTLRILSEAITVLLWTLSLAVMDQLQWSLASRRDGVSLIQFIQLDLGVSFWGLLRLITQSPWKYKGNSLTRYA
jgi:hypothetical protein